MNRLLSFAFSILIAFTGIAFSQTYSVTDLGTLGGKSTIPHAINAQGQITGSSNLSSNVSHAFLYSGGTMTDLGSLGGTSALGLGINKSGQIAGYSTLSDGSYRGFLYSNGTMTALPTLSGNYGVAYGINASGQIIGAGVTSANIPAGVLIENGVVTDLGNLGGEDGTAAYGINDRGQIVGYSYDAHGDFFAYLWQNGVMTNLGTVGGPWSQASAINNKGQVTGASYLAGLLNGPHVFLYQNGHMRDLDKRSGQFQSWGFGINRSGTIVGKMQVQGGGGFVKFHAFVTVNGRMRDLNGLIASGSGWELDEAYGINDAGQITGYGEHNGQTRGFLLTPASN